ncbi:MAG: N-acetyltransferase [Parafannyhessea sp.]|uniref:N-acetyltransferase n=1 Tax=Parafannyhessea sp. TaxID=2847324 RepID=UPI003EFF1818
MREDAVRRATQADLDQVMDVYAAAREFMRQNGNPGQWGDGFPPRGLIEGRIARGELYVVTREGAVHAAFALVPGPDPYYARIEGGTWESDAPYVAIHQVASDGQVHGVFHAAVGLALGRCGHLRVDTHRDNAPMQGAILREGFAYRGIVHVRDHSPRLAYELVATGR